MISYPQGEIWNCDCLEMLGMMAGLGDKAQMCVTSPPYFGLRDYGVEGQIGLERTPEEYVAKLVGVFRAVREVLADDGTLWLNLGDSYNAAGRNGRGTRVGFKQGTNRASAAGGDACQPSVDSLKEKDLIGIPWRVAFALQSDGWYLRQDIIWHKPNPMPESVKDRCTKSHEYIFLLSKNAKYYFDAEAVAEPSTESTIARLAQDIGSQTGSDRVPGKTNGNMKAVGSNMRNRRSVWTITTKPFKEAHFATFPPALIEPCILAGSRPGDSVIDPFMGAGTTAVVAESLGRRWVGSEINPEYCEIIRKRLEGGK